MVFDDDGRVLLVRHRYRPGWFFPGGGVERHETIEVALSREIQEEAGVVLTGPVEFHGLFANVKQFPGDHIAVFVVRHWEQPAAPKPNAEIAELGFFDTEELPPDTDIGSHRRLLEVTQGHAISAHW